MLFNTVPGPKPPNMISKKRKSADEAINSTAKILPEKKTKSIEVVNEQVLSSRMQPLIEDFPRGGARPLSALEFRDVADKASKDVLFHVCDHLVVYYLSGS